MGPALTLRVQGSSLMSCPHTPLVFVLLAVEQTSNLAVTICSSPQIRAIGGAQSPGKHRSLSQGPWTSCFPGHAGGVTLLLLQGTGSLGSGGLPYPVAFKCENF